jgi:hypothetical protein
MFLPWWSIAVAAFAASLLLARKGMHAGLGSFLGAAILWIILATIVDAGNHSVLSARVAQVFFVNEPVLLVIVTGVVGGLAALYPGLCGFYLRSLLRKKQHRSSKYAT